MLPIPDQALGTATSTRYAACGRCCLECREGTRRGIPYMDDEMIEKAAMESDTFRQSAKMMSDIQAGRLTAGVDGNSGVVKSEGIEDEMIAGYDGFTKDQFVEGSSGIEPSEIGLNGFVESHPRTQEEVLVYWMQSLPAFRLEMKRSASATHKRNEMPSQLYSTQADDTLDYWRRKLPTNLRSADVLEPPTRAEVAKALAAVHRRKGTSGTGPLLAAQPMQTTPGSLQALQAVQAAAARSPRPAVPAFFLSTGDITDLTGDSSSRRSSCTEAKDDRVDSRIRPCKARCGQCSAASSAELAEGQVVGRAWGADGCGFFIWSRSSFSDKGWCVEGPWPNTWKTRVEAQQPCQRAEGVASGQGKEQPQTRATALDCAAVGRAWYFCISCCSSCARFRN